MERPPRSDRRWGGPGLALAALLVLASALRLAGVEYGLPFPLLNPGQPGILAPGAIRDGRCYVTLCYDRRAMDDYAADRLLARVTEELEKL